MRIGSVPPGEVAASPTMPRWISESARIGPIGPMMRSVIFDCGRATMSSQANCGRNVSTRTPRSISGAANSALTMLGAEGTRRRTRVAGCSKGGGRPYSLAAAGAGAERSELRCTQAAGWSARLPRRNGASISAPFANFGWQTPGKLMANSRQTPAGTPLADTSAQFHHIFRHDDHVHSSAISMSKRTPSYRDSAIEAQRLAIAQGGLTIKLMTIGLLTVTAAHSYWMWCRQHRQSALSAGSPCSHPPFRRPALLRMAALGP
eukprot:scaffold109101_cov53-Phaeocystis_antarctica.AAC.2